MNKACSRVEHIGPLFAATGWGEGKNHFVDISKMVWIGNAFKMAKLKRESNMQKMHIASSGEQVDLYRLDGIFFMNKLAS